MKLAVLIVGELRTFEFCRPSMKFLDNPDVDVYVSTWNVSSAENNVRVKHRSFGKTLKQFVVTPELVKSFMGRPCEVAVHDLQALRPMYPDCPMQWGWTLGWQFVRNSGKQYDFVYIIRPDLTFSHDCELDWDSISKISTNQIAFNYEISDQKGLEDTAFMARPEVFDRILSHQLLDYLKDVDYGNWHTIWYEYIVDRLGLELILTPLKATNGLNYIKNALITRWPAWHGMSYHDAMQNWAHWWHDNEHMAMAIVGKANDFHNTLAEQEFLTQPDISAENLALLYRKTRPDLPYGYEQHHTRNTDPGLGANKNIFQELVLVDVSHADDFENKLQALAHMMALHKSRPKRYFRIMFVDSTVKFTNPVRFDAEKLWRMYDNTQKIIHVNTQDGVLNGMDIIYANDNVLEEIFHPGILDDYRVAKNSGISSTNWWTQKISNYVVKPLPLTHENYIKVPAVEPGIYASHEYQLLSQAYSKLQQKLIPAFAMSGTTFEERQLQLPEILKKSLYLQNKLVIFDLDGVLLESRDMHYQTLNHALQQVGSEYVISPEDHASRYNGLPTAVKLAMLSKERGLPAEHYPAIKKLKQQATVEWLRNLQVTDLRHQHIFRNLKQQNNMIAVASNSVRETVKVALLSLGLMPYVDYYVSNEDVRNPKPHPEMFWKCMSIFGYTPDQTLIVEDSPVGLQAARSSGATVIEVANVHGVDLVWMERHASTMRKPQ